MATKAETEATKAAAKDAAAIKALKGHVSHYSKLLTQRSQIDSAIEQAQREFVAFLTEPGDAALQALFAARAAGIPEQGGGVAWHDEMKGALSDLAVHQAQQGL